MEVVNGEWYMKCCAEDSSLLVRTADEAAELIRSVGFLPLFSNDIEGFSLEEHTAAGTWWCSDEEKDPWEWRRFLAMRKDIAYGKFFEKKAGFIDRKWFPVFANYRRNGYDFDALFDDEMAPLRNKKVMDEFLVKDEWMSYELKEKAGFGKGGEKNYEGVISQLQMQTYLIVSDLKRKINKRGEPYGWHVAVFSMPEKKWGYKTVTGKYSETPDQSWNRIVKQVKKCYPEADDKAIQKTLGIKRS